MNFTELAHLIAPLIGLVTLLIGVGAVLRPVPMSTKFGVSVDASGAPFVIATGIRDVFMGLTVLLLYYWQLWSALGAINLCLGIVALSDFLVVQKYGDKKTSYVHLAGAISVVVYGVWLLV